MLDKTKEENNQISLFFKSTRFVVVYPFLILVLNLILKSLYLTSQDISIDEPFSIYHAQFAIPDLITNLQNYNNPPLFELLLHYWIKLFGITPLSVRLLPMLFACLSPLVLFYFAKRHFTINIAIVGALMLTFSDLLMFYAHDCRAYSLFIFLSLLSMYFFMEVLTGFTKASIFFFVTSSTLLIYMHYFGFFVLLIQGVFALLFYRKNLLKILLIYFSVLLLYLPHLLSLLVRFKNSVKGGWLNPPSGIDDLYNMLWIFSNFPFITVACIIFLVLALLKLIIGYKKINFHQPTVLIALWFLIPFFGMFFISFWVPMYIGRYLIFALPAYYLLVLVCLQYLISNIKWRGLLMLALILSMSFTHQLNPDKKQPLQKTIAFIKKNQSPNTIVVVCPSDFIAAFAYYYNRDSFSKIKSGTEYERVDSLLKSENVFCVNSFQELVQKVNSSNKKIIYFFAGSTSNSKTNILKQQLDLRFHLESEKQMGPTFFINVYSQK